MTHRPLRGISLMLGALLFFAVLDATAKYLTQELAVPFIVWVRYLVQCLLMIAVLGPRLGRRLLATRAPGLQILRGLLLTGCTTFGIAALQRMPLAETTATVFITPLLVALLAGPLLGERLSLGRWLAILGGFVGVLLIARPGGSVTAGGLFFALGGAGCYALYQILTRRLSATESTLTLLFYTALVGTLCLSLWLPLLPWPDTLPRDNPRQWALLVALGVYGGGGHYLLTKAFAHAPASLLSPFLYVQLIWATLLGALVFDHWPDHLSGLGMVVIAVSGLALGLQQRRASQES